MGSQPNTPPSQDAPEGFRHGENQPGKPLYGQEETSNFVLHPLYLWLARRLRSRIAAGICVAAAVVLCLTAVFFLQKFIQVQLQAAQAAEDLRRGPTVVTLEQEGCRLTLPPGWRMDEPDAELPHVYSFINRGDDVSVELWVNPKPAGAPDFDAMTQAQLAAWNRSAAGDSLPWGMGGSLRETVTIGGRLFLWNHEGGGTAFGYDDSCYIGVYNGRVYTLSGINDAMDDAEYRYRDEVAALAQSFTILPGK